jgi:hypothetical protein
MSSKKPLREVVRQLADTFNNPQSRESAYFNFYDDTLIIHGFPPNLQANKDGFKQFIYLLWRAFPDKESHLMISLSKEIRLQAYTTLLAHTKVNLWIFSQPINNSELMV